LSKTFEKFLALIPARGGSKGIPRKNLRPVAGKPLLAWTIEAAVRSAYLDGVMLSTDDDEIARVGREYGAQISFMRPPELAQDQSGALEVALHALDWMAGNEGVEPAYLLYLQPTSPLRTSADIDGAICLALEREADAVLGVCEASPHPWLARQISAEGVLNEFFPQMEHPVRRQDYPPAYMVNGALYLNRATSLRTARTFQPSGALAYVMPPERSLDIDSPWEMHLADLLLRHG
jgi:CMP-N,N'-diacetyllegionaminic acid synthase